MKRQSGFTLVEIAIVLVVIGLLLGGVLKGQELVLNSQIRNVISEYNNVASARFAYQDRYRQIPGDDNTANARWGTGVTDGDGNRVLDGAWDTGTNASEGGIFWHHLRNDGLVNGPRTGTGTFNLPNNAFDGVVGMQEGAFSNSTDGGIIGPVICQDYIPAKAALIVDTRLDDDPGDGTGGATGSLRGLTDTSGATMSSAAVSYNVNSNARYIMCREL